MRRACLGLFLFCLCLTNPAIHARRQEPPDPVFTASGFLKDRHYFSEIDFERIDTLSGNLVLTFTDLVLPGHAGMDLRFQRTYNRNSPTPWTFGIAGFPLKIEYPAGYANVPNTPQIYPIIITGDGAKHQTRPAGPGTYITAEFWRYTLEYTDENNVTWRLLELPNGYRLKFNNNPLQLAYLQEIRDPFNNWITLYWQPGSGQTQRLAGVSQGFEADPLQYRNIAFGFETETDLLPKTMTFAGRVWNYKYEGPNNSLSEAKSPENTKWTYEYPANAMRVTTPSGGQIQYNFGLHAFRRNDWVDQFGNPRITNSTVVTSRQVIGSPTLAAGTWTYGYDTSETGNYWDQETTVTYPDNRKMVYRNSPINPNAEQGDGVPPLGDEWGLRERWVKNANNDDIEYEVLDYESLPVGVSESVGTAAALTKRTLSRSFHTFVTDYHYRTTNFHDYHHPNVIAESGDRATTLEYQHTFGTRWMKAKVVSETITKDSISFVISRAFNPNADTGFVVSETRYGVTTSFEPDTHGNIAKITDAHDHETQFTYKWGSVKNTATEEFTIERDINEDGTVAWEKRRDLTTYFSHDGLGRLRQVTPPAGHPIMKTYDPNGTFVKVERGSGSTSRFTTYSLDGLGRVTGTLNAENVKTARQYDVYGRLTFESLPYVGTPGQPPGTWFVEYDELDRLKKRRHTDNHETSYSYSNGVDVEIVEQNGDQPARTTRQDWFPFGDPSSAWLVGVRDADEKDWSYAYNALGQLTQVTQPATLEHPNGSTRTWAYKVVNGVRFDLVAAEAHPESGSTTYAYDGTRLSSKQTPRGTFTFDYDGNDRLKKIRAFNDSSLHTVAITYDASDNRKTLNNGFVKSTFDYDSVNRLKKRTDEILVSGSEWLQKELNLDYDDWDNLTYIKYPSNRELTYSYDRANRVARTPANPQQPALAAVTEYHPSGAIRKLSMGNGLEEVFDYDADRYWLERISADKPQTNPVRLVYDYSAVGNVKQVTDLNSSVFSQTLTYDKLDRLTSFTRPGSAQNTYTYDALGNRRSAGSRTYNYDAGHRLDSVNAGGLDSGDYAFDTAGFMIADPTLTYTATPFDMVATATLSGVATTYVYDGDNTRRKKSRSGKDEYYFHGMGSQLLSEWESTDLGIRWRRDYIYLGSRLVASATFKQNATFTISPSANVTEGGVAQATITMTTSDGLPLEAAASVSYSTVAGSATTADYTPVGPTTAPFGAQASSGSTHAANVQTLNDIYHENAESFQISLNAPQNGVIGTPATTTVTIADNDPALIVIDEPLATQTTVLGAFRVRGWAVDQSAPSGTGIAQVSVKAYDYFTGTEYAFATTYGLSRPDVDAELNGNGRFVLSGYSAENVRLPPGIYKIQAWALRTVSGSWDAANFRYVTNIGLAVDTPIDNEVVNWNVQVAGWAANAAATSGTGITAVKVTATRTDGSGQPVTFTMSYGAERADLIPYFGEGFRYSGYSGWVEGLSPGQYRLDVCSYNGASLVEMKTRYVTVQQIDPRMSVDVPVQSAHVQQPFWVQGWALDVLVPSGEGTGVDQVHVWALPDPILSDPSPQLIFLGVAQYGIARPDVGAVFGQQFVNSGFSLQVPPLTWSGSPVLRGYWIFVYPRDTISGTFPISQAVYVLVHQ
jgi:YD repeat-containing protein